MAFRNRIVRLSQLIADQIVGATIATAATGRRVVIRSRLAPGGGGGIEFYPDAGTDFGSVDSYRFNGELILRLSADRVSIDTPSSLRVPGLAISNLAGGNLAAVLGGIDGNSNSYTTDSQGILRIPHALGAIPTTFWLTLGPAHAYKMQIAAPTSTVLAAYLYDYAGNLQKNVSVGIWWGALLLS